MIRAVRMDAIQDAVTKPGTVFSTSMILAEYITGFLEEAAHVIKYVISFYTYLFIYTVAILLYILCISVLYTDTRTELYAGIFRG